MKMISTIASTFVLMSLAVACKFGNNPGPGSSSTKDFAASNQGPNFAVVAAFLPEDPKGLQADLYNWRNLFLLKDLGVYNVSAYSATTMNPNSKSTDIIQAFSAIAPQMTASSTVVFTFSGRSSGGKLRLADGLFSFGQLVASLNAKPGQRFYFLHDSADLNGSAADVNSFLIDVNGSATKDLKFPEVVEFAAHSPVTAVTPLARLSVQFAGVLDSMKRNSPNATLDQFFKAVAASSGSVYRASNPAILSQTLLASYNSPIKASGAGTPVQPAAGSKYQLVEVSMVGCGPCQQLAEELAAKTFPNCTVKTIIGDGDAAGWTSFAGAKASTHLVAGAEAEKLKATVNASSMSSFPQLLLVDATGSTVVKPDVQGSYAADCGGASGGGGGILPGGASGGDSSDDSSDYSDDSGDDSGSEEDFGLIKK